jgi:hypothetical protein
MVLALQEDELLLACGKIVLRGSSQVKTRIWYDCRAGTVVIDLRRITLIETVLSLFSQSILSNLACCILGFMRTGCLTCWYLLDASWQETEDAGTRLLTAVRSAPDIPHHQILAYAGVAGRTVVDCTWKV